MDIKWYESWFDTPFYHILYKNRNIKEAASFIEYLFEYLQPRPDAKLLDIACGKGRHARTMSAQGYDTTGIDISESSIAYAKQYEDQHLHFIQHDMRVPLCEACFDYAFNLFTSFGYFDTVVEHTIALKSINQSLKKDGLLILDYFNTPQILRELEPYEVKKEESIEFHIYKSIENNRIIKRIDFENEGDFFSFSENVYAFTLDDFEAMMAQSGFKIIEKLGNYRLERYDPDRSPRMLLICKKQ